MFIIPKHFFLFINWRLKFTNTPFYMIRMSRTSEMQHCIIWPFFPRERDNLSLPTHLESWVYHPFIHTLRRPIWWMDSPPLRHYFMGLLYHYDVYLRREPTCVGTCLKLIFLIPSAQDARIHHFSSDNNAAIYGVIVPCIHYYHRVMHTCIISKKMREKVNCATAGISSVC